jgi:ADP-ribosyl-[dinitrogen reductase] hydrolase
MRFKPANDSDFSYFKPLNTDITHDNMDPAIKDRARGALLGQLCGDSLGSLVEFRSPASILAQYPEGVRDLADGGTWNTLAGQPTDDSEMALCLARTLAQIHHPYSDLELQKATARAYTFCWYDSNPFDMGGTTSAGLRAARHALTGGVPITKHVKLRGNTDSQANGALMRVSPLGIFGWDVQEHHLEEWARNDAAITHPNQICCDASAIFACAIAALIRGGSAEFALADAIDRAKDLEADPTLIEALESAWDAPPADMTTSMGWVLKALQNAFYQLTHAESMEAGVIATVMSGGDTDTSGCICGALLGAYHGYKGNGVTRSGIPTRWTEAVLQCKALPGKCAHPRPRDLWPIDALTIVDHLL